MKIGKVQTNIYLKEENIQQLDVKFLKMIGGHYSPVWSLAYNPHGKSIISQDNFFLQVWDVDPESKQFGNDIDKIAGDFNQENNSVTYSPDGKHLIAATSRWIKIWSVNTKSNILDRSSVNTLAGHKSTIFSLACSPDGKRIVTGSADNTVKIWDMHQKQKSTNIFKEWYLYYFGDTSSKTLIGHNDWVKSVTFSPCGTFVATGSYDGIAKIWNVNSKSQNYGECVHTFSVQGHIFSIAYTPDGKHLVTGSQVAVKMWDLDPNSKKYGECIKTLNCDKNKSFWTIAHSPNGKYVITGTDEKTVRIWNIDPRSNNFGICIHTLIGYKKSIDSAAFSSCMKQVATGTETKIALWELKEHDNFIKDEINWKKEKVRKTDKFSDLSINYL